MEKYESKKESIALFWYNRILPFIQKKLGREEKKTLIEQITKEEYWIPFSKKIKISKATLLRKILLYLEHGFGGLKGKERNDKGKKRALSGEIIQKAIMLKEELPERSVRKIIMMLKNDKSLPEVEIAPATLYRIFEEKGLNKKNLSCNKRSFIHFAREKINELWQSDATDGIYLPDPKSQEKKKKVTHLFAFIDDCSRLVTHGEFYFNESLPKLENCLQKAIIKRGLPNAIYVDNHQVYNAIQLELICADLGIKIYHTEPYTPEGKGKVEKFFGFVQSDFIPEVRASNIATIEELNHYFISWLEIAYHRKVHHTLQCTPLEKWMSMEEEIRYADSLKLKEVFLWREKRIVNKYGEISVCTNFYKVDEMLIGKEVEVRYDPFDLSEVYIFINGNYVMRGLPVEINRSIHKSCEKEKEKKGTEKSGISYLEILTKKYDELIKEQIKPISYVEIMGRRGNYLSLQGLEQIIEKKLGIKLTAMKKATLEDFHKRYGPFTREKVEEVELNGSGDNMLSFINILNKIKNTKIGGK